MNENKCPFCGDAMITTEDKIVVCENIDCATMFNEWDYPKVCAAMELARAEVVLDKSSTRLLEDGSIQDGTIELEDWSISHQQIMKRFAAAKDRVLEVFK